MTEEDFSYIIRSRVCMGSERENVKKIIAAHEGQQWMWFMLENFQLAYLTAEN